MVYTLVGKDKQRVLVIDDDKEITSLFSMVLGMVGYECDVANSAREALIKLAVSSPDLVLLDMRLDTEVGGEDILYQIRGNPRLKNTRVVLITGHPSMAEPFNYLADLTMLKPVDIEQLKKIAVSMTEKEPATKGEYFRDPVTGMYNQDFFYSRLEHAVERAKRRQDFIFGVCVFMVALKQPNEAPFDPAIFDKVLREAAICLVHNLRPTDTIARLSYYKFATLHEELKSAEAITIIRNRIQTLLTPAFRINDQNYSLLYHIGSATSASDYRRAGDLLAIADRDLESAVK